MCFCTPSRVEVPVCALPACLHAAEQASSIGQQPKVGGWFCAFELECVCGTVRMTSAQIGLVVDCRKCPRLWRIEGFQYNPETESLSVALTLGIRRPDPASKLLMP